MTVHGGKIRQEDAVVSPATPFAPLKPIVASPEQGVQESLQAVAHALTDYPRSARVGVRLANEDVQDSWELLCDSASCEARRGEPEAADVYLVLREDTWMEIVRGNLAPFDALFGGRLRVGGDFVLATDIARHLSDPSVPFVPPC